MHISNTTKNIKGKTMLNTDYLIIGSGAVGMAFADTIFTETNESIIIVDKLHKPGGHWNFAYPFVKLHQPSAFYGVNSTELSKGRKDTLGLNKGLEDLATGPEICAYFEDVMQHKFLPSDRVKYFPLCEYMGSGNFISTLTDETFEVTVNKKIVDATHLKTIVPSTHTPGFEIAPEVHFIPINKMPNISKKPSGCVVIGAGKTGIDACLWLLENHVDPNLISWIVPRDSWLLDRKNMQVDKEFFECFLHDQVNTLEALAMAESIHDLFERLESGGTLLRIDKTIQPTMYRCATISQLELEQLRRIKNVIRKGRVKQIEKNQIILEKGTAPTSLDHVHIDCSANGFSYSEVKPIFSGNLITPQTVRSCQPTFSAAFIARVETLYEDEKIKNEICTPIPLPDRDTDWITLMSVSMKNHYNWNKDSEILKWLHSSRLEGGFSKKMANIHERNEKELELLQRLKKNVKPAIVKIHKFMKELSNE